MSRLTTMTVAVLMTTSFAFGQNQPPIDSLKTPDSQRMQTLFSGVKKPIKYVGLSVNTEFQYGALAGQFTTMAGMSGMLHLNKKWGIGLAGYGTTNRNFAPTSLNAAKALNLNVSYGGLKLEYTPRPNAAVHVSFPLLIGGGMARVDSVGSRGRYDGRNRREGNERNGRDGHWGNGTGFFVVQPGINLEANVFRFAKIYGGVSYRIVPSTYASDQVSTLPVPSAGQLSGLNLNAGVRVGIFDYNLQRTKRQNNSKRRLFGKRQ